jgi:hypothetical protein
MSAKVAVLPLGIRRSATAAIVFFVIEKSSSQVFFLSVTPLIRLYIVKNDLASSQNALSMEDLIFIRF